MKPTHIITQTQYEVCAVSFIDTEEAARLDLFEFHHRLPGAQLPDGHVADMWQVGAALGAVEGADQLVQRLQRQTDEIAQNASSLPTRLRMACIEWIDPLMAAGNWMPELIEMAGGTNLFGDAGKHSPWIKWEELIGSDTDRILIKPCGFDIKRTLQDVHLLTSRDGWESLRAVRSGCVFIADGKQYFNRPGPKLLESLEILAEVMHPGIFRFGYECKGWIRFQTRPP